jgi:4-coumarate--CoA ligase (photoactive yellow protein activation family)
MNKIYVKNAVFAVNACEPFPFFKPPQLRRMNEISKLALYCAAKILDDENIDFQKEKDDIGLIISAPNGSSAETCAFMDSIIDYGDILASPTAFSSSVHNYFETSITSLLNLRGCCLTLSQPASALSSAIITAKSWLLSKRCSRVLLGFIDEANPAALKEYGSKIKYKRSAAFFFLTLNEDGEELLFDEKEDIFNPIISACQSAKGLCPLLTKQESAKIVNDFIKTSLAQRKMSIMSVFENDDIKESLKSAGEENIKSILNDLKTAYSIESDIDLDNFSFVCKNSLLKSSQIPFSTSGSLGKAKINGHSKEMIKEEVNGVSFLFEGIERIVSAVPVHHSYGFIFSLMLPKFLGIPVRYIAPMPFLKWQNLLKENDLLIGFPLFFDKLIDLGFKFPKGISILTSTAPCPDDLIVKLYENGAKSLIEIYGSSESGAIGYRKEAKKPFTFLPFWKYAYEDSKDMLYRKTVSFSIEMPDIIKMQDNGDFFVIGRKDNAVQIAGINIYPLKVENILKSHPFIKSALVRLGKERLKAFIVLKENIDQEKAKKDIFDFMNNNLTAHEIPKNIKFGSTLPQTPFGKKTDWQE